MHSVDIPQLKPMMPACGVCQHLQGFAFNLCGGSYDFQTFFDLLQRTGEEMNLMAIEDEKLDDVVPSVSLHTTNSTDEYLMITHLIYRWCSRF